jgi:hypothetical protein
MNGPLCVAKRPMGELCAKRGELGLCWSAAAMTTVSELLIRAKHAIESGETSLRTAAEDIAAAQAQGATQRQIAEAVGKSAAW